MTRPDSPDDLRAEVDRLAARQHALAELGRTVADRPPLRRLLTDVADMVCRTLGADLALVVQQRPDGRHVVDSSHGGPDLSGTLVPLLLASRLPLTAEEPVHVPDLAMRGLPGLDDLPPALRGRGDLTVLPLRGVVWTGAMLLFGTPSHGHDDGAVDFLSAVASLLAEALGRAEAEFDLQERIKELSTIAAIGRLVHEPAPPATLLASVADVLARGMQFPEHAVARIEVDGLLEVSDGGPAALAEQLTAPITSGGRPRGSVSVGHRTPRGFLPGFEQQLVDAVAETLSLWLQGRDRWAETEASEARLRSVLEQVPGIVWTVDTDLFVLGHAGRGHALTDLEPDERRGRRLDDVLGDDHAATAAARAALEGTSSVYESVIGSRQFETRVEPLRGPDGVIGGAIAIGVDVTESRRAQELLDESRRRLEGLFDNAHDALLLADDDGRYVDANPAAERLTGYSRDELLDMRITDLLSAPPRRGFASFYERFREVGEHRGEWRLLRADGVTIETEFDAVADIVPGVHLAVVTDVTSRNRAQAALRASEERFRRLAENARDAIYRIDVTGTPSLEYVSPAVQELLGCTPEVLYAEPELALRMLDAADRDRLVRCLTGPREAPAPFVARLVRPDGREVWVEERHAYVLDEVGRHVATEGVIRDITARKRVEDQLRAGLEREHAAAEDLRSLNEMKDVFLSAVSHELRTPLTALKGMSATMLAQHGRLDDEQQRLLLERLVVNADRLQSLLDDLLDIDRLTRGAALLQCREVDVADVVARTLERLPTDGRAMTVHMERVRARIDEAKVERVVENLVANALRHTGADVPVWVHVEDDDTRVVVRVEDAGPGVPEHLRDQIFEPFEMGDSPAARVGGLGIGLNLVARFVQLHHGTVTVGERDGGGAAFVVRLPKEPVGADAGQVDPVAAT